MSQTSGILLVQVGASTHLDRVYDLDGARFRFATYTNKVDGRWYLDISDSLGTPIVLGLGLACGCDLLYPYRARPVPAGKLWVQPQNAGADSDPDLDGFADNRFALWYWSLADQIVAGAA
jgi:hypothetical protein